MHVSFSSLTRPSSQQEVRFVVVAWLHTHVCRNVPMLQCAWFGGLPFLFSDERRRTDDGRTESSTVNDISSWWNEGIRSILNSILNVKFMLTLDLYLRLPLFSQPTSHRPNTRYRDQSRIKIFTIGVPPSSPSSLFLALSIEYRVSSIEYRSERLPLSIRPLIPSAVPEPDLKTSSR